MSISLDYALEHKNDPAVLCCRAEAGTVLSEHNLEDPAIFDDLVDSHLLDLTGALKIGQVLGATLKETCLIPILPTLMLPLPAKLKYLTDGALTYTVTPSSQSTTL